MTDYDYRGAIHCHSTYSDGTGTMEEIAAAANEVGLDFVIMTDHDTMKPLDEGHDGWKESTLFIQGTEITPEKNHYIAFGEGKLKGLKGLKKKSPQEIIDHVKKNKWLGFIAHPDHKGTKKFSVPPYPWEAWDATGYTGMGLWDLMTDFQSLLDRDNVTKEHYTDFVAHLAGPRAETLARWDELNKDQLVVGIGEIDNHCAEREYEGEKIHVFPYDWAFKTICNHVLLDNPLERDAAKAKKQILGAISKGRFYVSFDWWSDPTEFNFEIDDGENSAVMGGEFPLVEMAEVIITLPETGLINVILNGESVHEVEADELILEIREPGVYRVEVMKNDLVWILSNPIRVTGEAAPVEEKTETETDEA